MDKAEQLAREACKAAGLDPDERIDVKNWHPADRSPDDMPIIHEATGLVRGMRRPRWRSYLRSQSH